MADSARTVYHPINVDGWKGVVLVDAEPASRTKQLEIWRTWLAVLVTKPANLAGMRVLKTSKTVEVIEAQNPLQQPRRVVCKQTKTRGAKDALLALWRRSPARRNFDRSLALQRAGIGTARPLAWLESGWPKRSWLVTEFLDGITDLDSYVLSILPRLQPGQRRTQRDTIINSLVHVFRGLEKARLYHRDMKASNLLLAQNADGLAASAVFVVDLEGLEARRAWRSPWKPIARLAASLLQYPAITPTDYARFLRAYLVAGGADGRAWRDPIRSLRKQAARYAQAARKRKSEKLDGYSG